MEIIKNDGSSISLVRYFEYNDKKILIFDNDEGIDANGHITIHICEVDMSNGIVATSVLENDMDMIRNVIKMIVKENRIGMLVSIKDLNYNELNGISILNDWPLKMMPNYVDIIKMNQPIFELEKNVQTFDNNFNPFNISEVNDQPLFTANSNDLKSENTEINVEKENNQVSLENVQNDINDYEKMYFEQVTINNNLSTEIELYKSKLEQIKNIIEK